MPEYCEVGLYWLWLSLLYCPIQRTDVYDAMIDFAKKKR